MKMALELFNLTKREQRAVILIIFGLLAITIANHYREARSHVSTSPTSLNVPAAAASSPAEDGRITSEETP